MPGMDGFEVCRRLKESEQTKNIQIVAITSLRDMDSKIKGIELGADDYIVKPFRPRELVSRVNAVLRRVNTTALGVENHTLVRGAIRLLLNSNEVQMKESKIRLTPTECKVLYALMKNDGQTLSSKILLTEILGREDGNTEIIRTYIRRLRSKLQDSPPSIILNDRGGGYRFVTPK